MFKNLILYRYCMPAGISQGAIEDALQLSPYVEIGATQERSVGWVPPRGEEHGVLCESIAGQYVMRFFAESKLLPAGVLNRKVNEKAERIEKTEGRKPGKKEKKELKDEAKLDLLPMAFTATASTWVWIDPMANLLAIDAPTQSRADEIVTLLVESIPGFALALIDTQTSPQAAMAHWLMTQEPPAGFSIDRQCELKAADESKASVRYARHPLDIDEVRQHIEHGKLPTKLALTWDDRVSFLLTEGLQIKGITLLDAVMDGTSQDDSGFDTDVSIATGELSRLIPDLIDALGGEGRTGLGELPASLQNTVLEISVAGQAQIDKTDPLYADAAKFVASTKSASISQLQRHLKTGYMHAAGLIHAMQQEGLVTEPNASGQRSVRRTRTGPVEPPVDFAPNDAPF